jgi:hypothetical protein
MASNATETQCLIDSIEKDFKNGNAIGWFPSPPFPNGRLVPRGTVPKTDGSLRGIDDLTRAGINDASDKVVFPFEPFNRVVLQFDLACRAAAMRGTDACIVKHDIRGAYTINGIRPVDRPLTQSFVQGKGYAYRTQAGFGGAVYGYRWEVCGGLLLQVLYLVMSRRLAFNSKISLIQSHTYDDSD